MLLAIREKARGWIAWVVIILIGAAFALFGLSSYMGPAGEGRTSATVGGTDIPRQQLDRDFSNLRMEIERSRGSALSEEEELLVRREALDRIINQTVIMQYVEERGMRITDQDLAGVVRSFDQFQTNGRFDRQRYEAFARQQGTTPAGLEQRLRQDVLLQTLIDGLGETAVVTDGEIDRIVALERQQRQLRYLVLDADAFEETVSVSGDEIAEYYEANRDEFVSAEEVQLDYVMLDRDAVRDRVEISESELRARFEQIRDREAAAETRTAGHILVAVREDADEEAVAEARARIEDIQARLDEGESFEELAEAESDDASSGRRGGMLGEVERGIYGDAFDDVLFSMEEEGAVSNPVRTEFGFHLIRLEGIQAGEPVEFEDMRAEIEEELIDERSGSVLFDEQTRLDNLAYDMPGSLDGVAEEMGLEVRRSAWLSRDGGDEGIAAESGVAAAAFSEQVLEARENSDIIELEGDRYVVIRIAEHREPEQLALEDVEEEIEQRLRREKARTEARELAQALLARLRDGAGLEEVVEEHPEVSLEEPGLVGRVGVEPALVLEETFRLPRPEDGPSLGLTSIGRDRYAVLEVSEVIDGDPSEIDAETREQLREQLRAQASAEAVNAFVRELRAQADVEIKEERLQ